MARTLFSLGALILAAKPAAWLVRSWLSPAYDSAGLWVALLAAGLVARSLASPRVGTPAPARSRRALELLVASALARLGGQLAGVNVVAALALVADVWALALLAGLDLRRRPLSPGWLACLFAASFPIEFLVRRTVGFGLQGLSAAGACAVLALGPDPVRCEGVRLFLSGEEILVDLPCSGARGLFLAATLFAALAALLRPRPLSALGGAALVFAATAAANVLRIVVLALGAVRDLPVFDAPWHDAFGLGTLALGVAPLLFWAQRTRRVRRAGLEATNREAPLVALAAPATPLRLTLPETHTIRLRASWRALAFVAAAIAIARIPARPLDVGAPLPPPELPAIVADRFGEPGELSGLEQAYFRRFGGGAAKARYDDREILLVRTTSPVRHLHSPSECLAGAGNHVRYLGVSTAPVRAARYLATAPDGTRWAVSVTFVSDEGRVATSVGEAVWAWLRRPSGTWTMVQRIVPADTRPEELEAWEIAVARALDLPLEGTERRET